jgi:hypothetical protein
VLAEASSHRYGVRAGLRRLLHGRRLVRLQAERRRLVRELGRVRAAYLKTNPSAWNRRSIMKAHEPSAMHHA